MCMYVRLCMRANVDLLACVYGCVCVLVYAHMTVWICVLVLARWVSVRMRVIVCSYVRRGGVRRDDA